MIKLIETDLEDGMNAARTSRRYDLFVLLLFSILQLFLHTNTSAYPIFFKQPKFLCRNSNFTSEEYIFERNCSKNEVCEKKLIKGVDFILNENSLDSFISELDIYCNPFQISILESAMFAGPSLSILLTPFLINNLGAIKTLKICGLFYIIFMIMIFQMSTVFLVTISFYGIFICTYTMYNCKSLYIIEMCESKKRSLFYGILNLNSGLAGIFVTVIIEYFNSLRLCFILNVFAIMIVILIIHYKFVESVRYTFLRYKDSKLIFRDLSIIAYFNGDTVRINNWIKQVTETNKMNSTYLELSVSENNNVGETINNRQIGTNSSENNHQSLIKNINFLSIMKFSSQIKTLVIFTFIIFIFKFSNVFLLLEIGHTKTLNKMIIFFTLDSIINVCSSILIEHPRVGRKKFIVIMMICNGFLFLIGFYWYEHYKFNFTLTLINRVFVSAGMTATLLFNFESYPTLLRATYTSMNKFFAMFFNIFTPYLIMNWRLFLFLLISVLFFLGSFFMLKLKETQGKKLSELPPELANKNIENPM